MEEEEEEEELFRIAHARCAIPDEIGPTHCFDQSADKVRARSRSRRRWRRSHCISSLSVSPNSKPR